VTGTVVWFTGLPSSGKSTLARSVADRLRKASMAVVLLDGDEVRGALEPSPGYSPEGREAFYETLARLAALLARQGVVVLVAATAHRRAYRDRARELVPRYVEVFVDVPSAECARRDPRGLYAAAAEGKIRGLPGADFPFEIPEAPDVVAAGGRDATAISRILDLLSP
jgi:adenylylsulfate kinase